MSYNPAHAAEHRHGCRAAARRPIRRYIRRIWQFHDGYPGRLSITLEILECGHFYVPSPDQRFHPTRTRRCEACYQEQYG